MPADPECFGILLTASIGATDNQTADSFNAVVCTPRWLDANFDDPRLRRRECESRNLVFGARLIVMRRWNFGELSDAVLQLCAQDAADWGVLGDRIGRVIPWEFAAVYDAYVDSHAGTRPPFPPPTSRRDGAG